MVKAGKGLEFEVTAAENIHPEVQFWYNHTSYLKHRNPAALSFTLSGQNGPVSWINFTIENQEAKSISQAPFGSFEGIALQPEMVGILLEHSIRWFKAEKIKKVSINHFARCYHPRYHDLIDRELQKAGFTYLRRCRNFHINLEDEIFSKAHRQELRRLQKAFRFDFNFREENDPDPGQVYATIKKWWSTRGYRLSLDQPAFTALLLNFPGRYRVFSVIFNQKPIAMAVVVQVNEHILYNFYPATDPDYFNFSPMVFLVYQLCNWAKSRGYKLLDLGIANLGQQELPGLIKFKRNMGANESVKLEYEKIL